MADAQAEWPVVEVAVLSGLDAPPGDPVRTVYLRPVEGGFEVLLRGAGRVLAIRADAGNTMAWAARQGRAVADHVDLLLGRLAHRPKTFAGLSLDRPLVMGIVNVTPDSFSDGGETPEAASAVERGLAMREAGADFLDIGGESTRPGAEPVSQAEEARRVVPVIAALASAGAVVSVDTRHAATMVAADDAGVRVINDITALTGDPDSLVVAAGCQKPVILMHMQGEPRTMQADPRYDFAPLDVYDFLADRIAACEAAGIRRADIAVDPGIGFGKTAAHCLQILSRLSVLAALGCPIVLGVSRKSFIARLGRDEPPVRRLGGSLAAALSGIAQGAHIVRVHDVVETRQAIATWTAIRRGAPERS